MAAGKCALGSQPLTPSLCSAVQRWATCYTEPGWSYQSTRPNLPRDTYPLLLDNINVIIYNGDVYVGRGPGRSRRVGSDHLPCLIFLASNQPALRLHSDACVPWTDNYAWTKGATPAAPCSALHAPALVLMAVPLSPHLPRHEPARLQGVARLDVL